MISDSTEYEAVIGLEVHCQLATETKIFCGCPAKPQTDQSVSEVAVNSHTCPICAGHPGTLPVLNQKAVEFAIQAGLATHCEIRLKNQFARKNYFYPDLPKGYQISQHDKPICEQGWLEIETKSRRIKRVRIERIHLEEDAGKNSHMADFSLVNLNRAGVPLIEIVSHPDMKTSDEAGAYLRGLHAIVTYLGICDGNMQEGNFRCDANVSVMPKGSKVFGTRAEIKNVNSFRFVEKAIDYEIARQIEVIRSGNRVVQETRTYDSHLNKTTSMRSKEDAQDYRYFPEPDLVPLIIEPQMIERLSKALPELPEQKRKRFIEQFGLSAYDAGVLTAQPSLVQFFERVLKEGEQGEKTKAFAKLVANWLTGEVSRLLNEGGQEIDHTRLTTSHMVDLVQLVQNQILSSTGAKRVLNLVWETGDAVEKIVDQEGLRQISDTSALEEKIKEVILACPQQAADFRAGKDKLLGFFVGQVMKKMGGKANPSLLGDLVRKQLSS